MQKWVRVALEWIASHRQTFYSIVGTVAVVVLIIGFTISNFRNLKNQAWEKYFAGQSWALSNNPDNATNFYKDVVNNYAHTPAASYALLGTGDLLYRQRKFQEAIDAYKQSLDKNPPKIILPFVLASLGAAQEDKGDYAEAINTYKRFISEFPDHYLTPKIQESLARTYEVTLNPDAAKEIYEKIITMYPSTLWSERSRNRYQTLAPQPFQMSPANNQPPVQNNPKK